jgi:hypothetical protein
MNVYVFSYIGKYNCYYTKIHINYYKKLEPSNKLSPLFVLYKIKIAGSNNTGANE